MMSESEDSLLNVCMNTQEDTINEIVEVLVQKNKSDWIHRQEDLRKQVLYFSPKYRDFIYKIISNRSLNIVERYSDGYIIPIGEPIETQNLKRKQRNKIYTNIRQVDTLPHELGHAVDLWFGLSQALTSNLVLSNQKTLQEILDEELEINAHFIYLAIMNEYQSVIASTINPQAYETFIHNIHLYNELKTTPINFDNKEITMRRKYIQKKLYESGFVDVYYQLHQKNYLSIMNQKYLPILDALSSKYDFSALLLSHHTLEYYRQSKTRPALEFFANLFNLKVTSNRYTLECSRTFLPQSFLAFEELFQVFYDYLIHHKKLNTIQLRKANDEL